LWWGSYTRSYADYYPNNTNSYTNSYADSYPNNT
jgi:hypothetical protein